MAAPPSGGGSMDPLAATGGAGEMGTLEAIHHNLAGMMALLEGKASEQQPGGASGTGASSRHVVPAGPALWVTQYVDYTSKYGLGYLLVDGSTGVYFNDSTKIVLAPGSSGRFQYMERVRSSQAEAGDKGLAHERFESHTLASYPPALHKKVTLLQHFRDYLLAQQKDKDHPKAKEGAATGSAGSEAPKQPPAAPRAAWGPEGHSDGGAGSKGDEAPLVFVKKWVRTRHAILFRLSNHTVQVMFLDNTEVVLSREATVVTFADKQGRRRTMGRAEVVEAPRSDVTKRLKYTKDILRQLISSGKR